MGVWEIYSQIDHDIKDQLRRGQDRIDMWWSFPGFALGRFRSLNENGSPGEKSHKYDKFKEMMINRFGDRNIKISAMIYNEDGLKAYYAAYESQFGDIRAERTSGDTTPVEQVLNKEITPYFEKKRLQACVEAENMFASVAQEKGVNLYRVSIPDTISDNVIVIGSVVYHIHTYGGPVFNYEKGITAEPYSSIEGYFAANATGSSKPIKLVAFRYDDSSYAQTVSLQLAERMAMAKRSSH